MGACSRQKSILDSPGPRKIVALEFGAHYMKIRQLAHIFNNGEQIDFYFRAIEGRYGAHDFNLDNHFHRYFFTRVSELSGRIFPTLVFYWRVLRGTRRFDVLWILTGPEQNVLPDALFLRVLIGLRRPTVVLSIGATERWLRQKPALKMRFFMSLLRRAILKKADGVTFETNTQKADFQSKTERQGLKLSTLPTYSSDVVVTKNIGQRFSANVVKPFRFRLGLLGGVAGNRRDYDLLVEALNVMLGNDLPVPTIVILGNTLAPEAIAIIEKFREITVVEHVRPFLQFDDFVQLGLSCDALVSPLRPDKGYGISRGSGTFGDAILLNKVLFIPSFADPEREFKSFSEYYENSGGLSSAIQLYMSSCRRTVTTEDFRDWRGTVIAKQILRDLRLEFLTESVKDSQVP